MRSRRKLLFSLIPLLVLLVSAELWFRAHPHRDAYETNSGLVVADDELVWRLRPIEAGPLATNSLGLRDGPYRAGADAKVLVLGDSVSWGNGITDPRRVFPSLLEGALDAARPGRVHEVINAGVPGYSTFQELRYFELVGADLEPDAVLLQFTLNDVVERYRALTAYGGNNYFLGVDTRRAARGLYGVLLRRSRTFEAAARWVQSRARARELYVARSLAVDPLAPALDRAWRRTLAEVDGVRLQAAGRGLPLLLLIAPFRFQADDPIGLRQPQDRLIAYAREHDVQYVDVLAHLDEAPFAPAAAFNDASHFSELGHEWVAGLLLEPVLAMLESGSASAR